MTVREDEIGLYINAGGYIARPVGTTQFKKGDKPKAFHFGSTPLVGIGKDAACNKGEYLENWLTCGMTGCENKQEEHNWHVNNAKTTYPLMFKE